MGRLVCSVRVEKRARGGGGRVLSRQERAGSLGLKYWEWEQDKRDKAQIAALLREAEPRSPAELSRWSRS